MAHSPIDKTSPKNSVDGKVAPPVTFAASHASAVDAVGGSFNGSAAGETNISRRFANSAFHQRNNPFRNNLVTRKSGTNPSYNSRQPELFRVIRPVARLCFAKATRRRQGGSIKP